jgi:hypothetical protein
MNGMGDGVILIAEARIARQRELIALLEARGCDSSQDKSLLSALQYSLKLLKRREAQYRGQDSHRKRLVLTD